MMPIFRPIFLLVSAFLWAVPIQSLACEEELQVREVLPQAGASGIPIDSRIIVAFIGMGTLEDFDVSVYNGAAQRNIAVDRSGWCYDHERPTEVHCWARLVPRQALEPWTTYEIRIQRVSEDTGSEPEEMEISSFTTDEWEAGDSVPALGLEITDAWEMEPSELDRCDWDAVSRWWFDVDPVVDDATGMELFHIYELDEDGLPNTEDPIHSLFAPQNIQVQQIKQFLDASVSHSHCFGIQREGPTGRLGTMTTDCYDDVEGPKDTGGSDGEDTDHSSSDTQTETTDSDADVPSNEAPEETLYPVPDCGCSVGINGLARGGVFAFLGLLIWGQRRRRID